MPHAKGAITAPRPRRRDGNGELGGAAVPIWQRRRGGDGGRRRPRETEAEAEAEAEAETETEAETEAETETETETETEAETEAEAEVEGHRGLARRALPGTRGERAIADREAGGYEG
jgi:hypothetical protein